MADVQSTKHHDIQAVVFDAVGTVMFPVPTVADAYRVAIAEHCRYEIAADVVKAAVTEGLKSRSADGDLATNEQAEREFWADLIRQLCPCSEGFQACFYTLFEHFAKPTSWKCFPDVAELLSGLAKLDLKLAIASNFDSRLNTVCDGLGDLAGISCRIISSQVGFRKPAPEFFSAVVDILNIPAENILLVGDDLINDVQGAVNAGFQSAWICRSPSKDINVPDGVLMLTDLRQLQDILKPLTYGEQARMA